MRSGQRVLIEALAAGGALAVVAITVVGGLAGFAAARAAAEGRAAAEQGECTQQCPCL